MSLVHELIPLLRCPGCSGERWELRTTEARDLSSLEGTLACRGCGLAFAARGGVLDMIPEDVETRTAALRRRLVTRPLANAYEEVLRHLPSPLASPLSAEERSRWLSGHAPTVGTRRIIDLGCGRGGDLEAMMRTASPRIAVGVDRSQVLLAEAAARARVEGRGNQLFVRADLARLPFAPHTFGWASCTGVLHRLRRPAAALADVARLLEPGGVITCLAAHDLDGGPAHLGQVLIGVGTGVRFFTRDELITMLYGAGLQPLEVSPYGAVALVAARRPRTASEPAPAG